MQAENGHEPVVSGALRYVGNETGDEEEPSDGYEKNEVACAAASRTVEDLRAELAQVRGLC